MSVFISGEWGRGWRGRKRQHCGKGLVVVGVRWKTRRGTERERWRRSRKGGWFGTAGAPRRASREGGRRARWRAPVAPAWAWAWVRLAWEQAPAAAGAAGEARWFVSWRRLAPACGRFGGRRGLARCRTCGGRSGIGRCVWWLRWWWWRWWRVVVVVVEVVSLHHRLRAAWGTHTWLLGLPLQCLCVLVRVKNVNRE